MIGAGDAMEALGVSSNSTPTWIPAAPQGDRPRQGRAWIAANYRRGRRRSSIDIRGIFL